MAKRRKRHCHYYCGGYCFWNGDTGLVCDTGDNSHDGYCPMVQSDRELEEIAKAMIAEYEAGSDRRETDEIENEEGGKSDGKCDH